jgi:hypothetical protein
MSLLAIVLFYVLVFVQAVPLVKRIVVSPQITSPTASTTWNVGDKVTVTWFVSFPMPPLVLMQLANWRRTCVFTGTHRASRRQATLPASSYSVTRRVAARI